MSQQKNSDECCCDKPQVEEVKGDLEGSIKLGTICRNCGTTKSASAKN